MNEKPETEEMDSRALLAELLKGQREAQRFREAVVCVGAALAALLLIAALVVLRRAVGTLGRIESPLTRTDALAGDVSARMGDMNALAAETNDMVADAEELIGNANRVVVSNTEAVTEAVKRLNGVDFALRNQAINDLADAVRPLAKIVRFFE